MERKSRHRAALILALTAGILYIINALILWLDLIFMSDVLYAGSFLWRILGWRESLFTMFGFALLFGFTVSVTKHLNFKKALPLYALTVCLFVFKYLLEALSSLLCNAFDMTGFLIYQLPSSLSSLLAELLQWLLILLITKWLTARYPERASLPLIAISVLSTGIKILNRILIDLEYGAPTSSSDLLYMITAYLSDILLYGLALYFLMMLVTKTAAKCGCFCL